MKLIISENEINKQSYKTMFYKDNKSNIIGIIPDDVIIYGQSWDWRIENCFDNFPDTNIIGLSYFDNKELYCYSYPESIWKKQIMPIIGTNFLGLGPYFLRLETYEIFKSLINKKTMRNAASFLIKCKEQKSEEYNLYLNNKSLSLAIPFKQLSNSLYD